MSERPEWDLVLVVAAGGVLGAEARYALGRAVVHHGGGFPWSTVLINVIGSALLGLLMGIVETRPAHRLVRPFAGVGILGGFTTFSTFAVDADTLFHDHRPAIAIGYLAVTIVGCLIAVTVAFRAMTGAMTRALRGNA